MLSDTSRRAARSLFLVFNHHLRATSHALYIGSFGARTIAKAAIALANICMFKRGRDAARIARSRQPRGCCCTRACGSQPFRLSTSRAGIRARQISSHSFRRLYKVLYTMAPWPCRLIPVGRCRSCSMDTRLLRYIVSVPAVPKPRSPDLQVTSALQSDLERCTTYTSRCLWLVLM
ncbi:hypothetical protein PENSPDRAFT_383312 [Peniophora sp. CONT]|nr:hypothetical protein PENSPDRAFT_383312 [Peniophora sp. CONT]